MTTTAQYPRPERGNTTTVYAEAPRSDGRLRARCGEHGERLEELEDVEGLEIEVGGMTYSPVEGLALAYCPDCLADLRHRTHRFRDQSDRELVINRIEGNFYGDLAAGTGGFRDVFEPATVTVGDGIEFCPYCGESVEVQNRDAATCVCPDHGRLRLSVAQEDA